MTVGNVLVPELKASILNSTKKILGVDENYTVFDLDIMTHINSVFMKLNQLGVGPVNGYMIEDANATWLDYLGTDRNLNAVKTFIYLNVRMLFDPPTTSYHITAMENQIAEYTWRLNVAVDTTAIIPGLDDEAFFWTLNGDVFPPEAQEGDLGLDPVTGNVWRKA